MMRQPTIRISGMHIRTAMVERRRMKLCMPVLPGGLDASALQAGFQDWTMSAMPVTLTSKISPSLKCQRGACRPIGPACVVFQSENSQARNVPSSSFSAHLITSSSFSLPCVNLEIMTVLIAWL